VFENKFVECLKLWGKIMHACDGWNGGGTHLRCLWLGNGGFGKQMKVGDYMEGGFGGDGCGDGGKRKMISIEFLLEAWVL